MRGDAWRGRLIGLMFIGIAACGDRGEQPPAGEQTDTTGAGAGAGTAATMDTAGVITVRMTGDGVTTARYEPERLTIAPGARVRFVNVSGWPHNIAFWPDSIPSGASSVLQNGMPNTIAELQGELLTEPNATYTVSFANAPAGEYKGYCTPHLPLGMRIWITVQP